jgi:hypothetical protein
MGRVKDLWFAEMERKFNELLDQGMDEDRAYEKATNAANRDLADRLVDRADDERKRRKEEGNG